MMHDGDIVRLMNPIYSDKLLISNNRFVETALRYWAVEIIWANNFHVQGRVYIRPFIRSSNVS